MSMQLRAIRFYFSTLSVISPTLASKKAFKTFQKVRIKNIRNREKKFFTSANSFEVPFENENLTAYELGDPNGDLVVLVHGWESNAGSMSRIASALAEEGKQVVLFNLPGHAFYENDSTNLLVCRNAMTAVLDHINPGKPFSIVSHSFGSAVTSFTLADSNYEIDQLFYLTGPNKVENIFMEFKKIIHLGDRAYNKMVAYTESILGRPIAEISIANNLSRASFNKLNLIHDEEDKILPFSNSIEIKEAIPNSEIISFESIGHYRMLWNDDVVDLIRTRLSDN